MYLLGLAFLAWIVCGGLVMGYFVENEQDIADQFAIGFMRLAEHGREMEAQRLRLASDRYHYDVILNAHKLAITEADKAAKAAQKAIDDHEQWVANERRKNAEVIQRARKAARGHNG